MFPCFYFPPLVFPGQGLVESRVVVVRLQCLIFVASLMLYLLRVLSVGGQSDTIRLVQ